MKHQYLVVVLVILIILLGYSYYYSLKEPKLEEIPQERTAYVVPEEETTAETPTAPEEIPTEEPKEMEKEIKKEAIIKIMIGYLDPKDINITTGTTVTWVNDDVRPHKITDTRRRFYGDRFLPGESYSYTFDEEGTYYYFDVIFFSLKGKIIVEESEDLSAITGSIIYSNTSQRMTGVLVLFMISMIIGTYYWFK
jgi:plastocyanin